MEKIITALDGLHLSRSAIDYTLFIAQNSNAHIVGVFVEDMLYHSFGFSELATTAEGFSDRNLHKLKERDAETRQEAVQEFQNACQKAGLPHSVHRDRNVALRELVHESIYADLLIIDSRETFTRFQQQPPSDFMQDLLTDVQCPVFVVPPVYKPIEKLVMLYNGSPSSVYAVKMFSYLVPYLKYLDTEILSIIDDDGTTHAPDYRLMKELMKRHFPNASYTVLKGDPKESILEQLSLFQETGIVVMGAYQRSRVSRWFKPSMADHIIKKLSLPLFIAHNK